MDYDYPRVRREKGKGVLKVTLNQPDTLNAFTPDLERELHEALQEGDRDAEVFCMVICGAGRAFSSGYAMGAVPGVHQHRTQSGCQQRVPMKLSFAVIDDRVL